MKLNLLRSIFQKATRQCRNVEGLCPLSCEDERTQCYIIDNNGFIVIAKDEDKTGLFLGEIEGALISQLLNMGVFRQVKLFDYQAMCKHHIHHHSGARSLLNPLIALMSAAQWILSNVLLFLLEFSLCPFWDSDNTVDGRCPDNPLYPPRHQLALHCLKVKLNSKIKLCPKL
ncbi:hypothetical protein GDO86_005123 [Hymenochirus boettgeri]|uniref:Voltage-dependent calcium channel alpha-2/delta subunit conserved region domain-containing protein n=1 Tax=Hymenochirus boettgeri TaxID=247094 RepID=A0A8T2J679_9PIPI|nr:hypothetical protein GDO86_005123 [Hymenochirus boettgeri]